MKMNKKDKIYTGLPSKMHELEEYRKTLEWLDGVMDKPQINIQTFERERLHRSKIAIGMRIKDIEKDIE